MQHTWTGRGTPRPISISLTSAGTVSHQVVACATTVGGVLSKCCSSSVTNLTIGWVSQSITVHNCLKGEYTHRYHTCTVSGITVYQANLQLGRGLEISKVQNFDTQIQIEG